MYQRTIYKRILNQFLIYKKTLIIQFGLVCLLAFFSGILTNQSNEQKVDDLLSMWKSKDKPGISVAVNKGTKTVYKRNFGMASLENSAAINDETIFLIASVSKQFTAFAINLLAAEGKLSLDDDINKYLPEMPEYEHPITIIHLLNHTSGLRDVDDLNGIIGVGLSDYTTFNYGFKLISNQKQLNFKPGSKYDYSNSGYILLAKIVENLSATDFRKFMDSRVFKPLKMNSTFVMDNPFEVVENKATAYFSDDGNAHSRNNLTSANYGSTGIYTTLHDLNIWAKNFSDPKVGSRAIFNSMKTQGKLNDGERINYAMGQEIKQLNGYETIFHGGGQGAYRAYLIRFPETELSITLLSNSSYSTNFILDYVDSIANIYLPEKPTESADNLPKNKPKNSKKAPEINIKADTLKNFTGDYKIQDGLIFTIEAIDEGIQLLITGNEKPTALKPISNNEFLLTDNNSGNRIVFNGNSTSPSSSISYYQADFEYKGDRIELVEYDKKSIEFQELTGLFYSPELSTSYLLKHEEMDLIATHGRNLPIILKPHQPDVFNSSTSFFQKVEFKRNKNNEVIGLLVSGSRSKDIEFIKIKPLN